MEWKRVWVHPPPLPAWANFTLMMECTPESSRCNSVVSANEYLRQLYTGAQINFGYLTPCLTYECNCFPTQQWRCHARDIAQLLLFADSLHQADLCSHRTPCRPISATGPIDGLRNSPRLPGGQNLLRPRHSSSSRESAPICSSSAALHFCRMARINLSQAVLLWADLRFSMSACFGASVSRSAAAALFSCAIVCASSALHGCARRSSRVSRALSRGTAGCHVVRGLILLWHLSRKSAHAFRFLGHHLFCCCALVSQQLCPSAFLPQAHPRSVKCHHTARPNSRLLQDRLSILPCANLVIRQNPSGLPPP